MSPSGNTSAKSPDEREILRINIARAHDLVLYRQYNESDAAKAIGIHPVTLKRIRLAGGIAHIRLGPRAIRYFGFQIADHLIEAITCTLEKTPPTASEITSSPSAPAARPGIAAGTTQKPDAHTALHLARQALKPRGAS